MGFTIISEGHPKVEQKKKKKKSIKWIVFALNCLHRWCRFTLERLLLSQGLCANKSFARMEMDLYFGKLASCCRYLQLSISENSKNKVNLSKLLWSIWLKASSRQMQPRWNSLELSGMSIIHAICLCSFKIIAVFWDKLLPSVKIHTKNKPQSCMCNNYCFSLVKCKVRVLSRKTCSLANSLNQNFSC